MTNRKNAPTASPKIDSPDAATALPELDLMRKIFEQVEKETAKIAEELFEYLFDIDDVKVITGQIPVPKKKSIKDYIKSLNLLFKLSRLDGMGSFKIVNRRMVKELDKKTYLFCMCVDGGVSLDVLCEVVNQENTARTPKTSPVKITVTQFVSPNKEKGK